MNHTTEDYPIFLIGHLPIMVDMNYVVHFGRSKKIVFVLKYKISSTPIDVPQTTTTPWRGGGDTNKQTNKLGGGWQVYNEKIMCIQRVTM